VLAAGVNKATYLQLTKRNTSLPECICWNR